MGSLKFYKLKSHITNVDTRFLREFVPTTMFRSKLFIEENGSNFCANHSEKDDQVVPKKSIVVLSSGLAEKESLELQRGKDTCGHIADAEDSVFLHSGLVANTENSELENIGGGKADSPFKSPCPEEIYEENENLNFFDSKKFRVEGIDSVESEVLEDQVLSYEVELLPQSQFSRPDVNQESIAAGNEILIGEKTDSSDKALLEVDDTINWKSGFLEATDLRRPEDIKEECNNDLLRTERAEDLDDEYLELEPLTVNLTDISKESFCCGDAKKAEKLHEPESTNSEGMASVDGLQENKDSWDSDSDDEDESDVLWENQHLVQQMKMELKNCKIRGLPTISEEYETPKMLKDLKPLEIDQKFEYKDIMEEIQKFNKIYTEKMWKLDILNYQTLHAISFLQLMDSKVFTAGKKKSASAPCDLRKIWSCKVERIYVDPTHKLIMEMHRDLELVHVGQLCLSWEILCWLYVKAQELMEYDSKVRHSYNRVADEPFQGPRILNYVKNRCMVHSLLHVPTIKDDCLKDKKERRQETDTFLLEMLAQIIRESMLIFWEFLGADRSAAANVVLTGIQGTKIDLQDTIYSVLLVDIITNLHRKDRKIREQIRSQNCIAKKLQKHQESRSNHKLLTSQVELRLVSRLTTDQLVWCQKKLRNISFVSRRVHVEPSFLLFPC
ncbi:hypothetical protein Pfo_024012 [Paulownia fortunei]|nr:hypothetical protein Pfo_024012 [Paulownia fortunei]